MGLDMYAYALKTAPAKVVDFPMPQNGVEELHYWRKHPNLHGWMEELYRKKGGRISEFNCSGLLLDSADLDQLERDVKGDRLPATSGFFF